MSCKNCKDCGCKVSSISDADALGLCIYTWLYNKAVAQKSLKEHELQILIGALIEGLENVDAKVIKGILKRIKKNEVKLNNKVRG